MGVSGNYDRVCGRNSRALGQSEIFMGFNGYYRGLVGEPMKKMFLKLVLFCLCFRSLDGEFEM